jgi:hypothetical protein
MNRNLNGGYIGLLAILIVSVLIVYLMMKQFEGFGMLQPDTNQTFTESSNAIVTPIEQAQDVKKMVEGRNLGL